MTAGPEGLVLVTGGTGTLGRLVVRRLGARGQRVRVLSRRPPAALDTAELCRGDLLAGAGVAAAVEGARTIVHGATARTGDLPAAAHLLAAASRLTPPPHLVFVSIVGADRGAYGYVRTKLEVEQLIARSGLPFTILRATQFYDLILRGAAMISRLPVVGVPRGVHVQPVDADEVAARLVELALAEPAGRVPDVGGPHVATAAELIRAYLAASGRRRPVVELPVPGLQAFREGALLATEPGSQTGTRTWAEFLAERVAPP